ncbi:MAG: hydrogenase nickel incorporation protein HypB [Nitrosomonas sp.]|nr:hydrogenase nickel incorporation protein HypB [Nitrosomonas sp.]
MCTTCGCGTKHIHMDGDILHHHDYAEKVGDHTHHMHASGINESRRVRIEQAILAKNNHFAQHNRHYLAQQGIFMVNLVSSPGSGKTTILIETIKALQNEIPIAVIEGDQQTDQDAVRIRATGVPAVQINTGKGCHLDAHMVGHAMEKLDLQSNSLLFVENVGNLVCPAAFDLGEAHKVVILSVTEGEDKPLKYPDMFHAADVMLLNKCDLLPYLSFDVSCAIDFARRINPALQVIQISATQGSGLQQWIDWIKSGHQQAAQVVMTEKAIL